MQGSIVGHDASLSFVFPHFVSPGEIVTAVQFEAIVTVRTARTASVSNSVDYTVFLMLDPWLISQVHT